MITVLIVIAAMVALPWIVSRLFGLDKWIPLPMFQIFCGILLGPSALGVFAPELFSSVFSPNVRISLDTIQTLAIIVFCFIAGLEFKPEEIIQREGNELWIKALKVVVLPIMLAAAAFWIFFDSPQWRDPNASLAKFAWVMGVATCITALPMLVIASKSLGIFGTDLYRRLLALVVFDDLILWLTVSLIIAFGDALTSALLFFLATAIAYKSVPRLMDRLGESSWPTVTVTLVLLWSALSYWAGLHWVLGAFFAGMIIPKRTTAWMGGLETAQMYWLMPVFFIWTGLKVQWSSDLWTIIVAALGMWVVAVVTKFAGVYMAYRSEGWNTIMFKTAILQNKGLMEIFLATVMLRAQIISSDMFAAVVFMSLISVVAAVPLARLMLDKVDVR